MFLSLESSERQSACLLNYTSATSTTFPTNSMYQLCVWIVNCVDFNQDSEKFVPAAHHSSHDVLTSVSLLHLLCKKQEQVEQDSSDGKLLTRFHPTPISKRASGWN